MFQRDPEKKTVEIPVQIEDGSVKVDTDALPSDVDLEEDLPDVDGEVEGTLRFPAEALTDGEERDALAGIETAELFSSDTTIWLKMRVKRRSDLSQQAADYLKDSDLPTHGRHGVLFPIRLMDALRIRRRGLKEAELIRCNCVLPQDLPEDLERFPDNFNLRDPLPTLHQAFMHLSEVFERHRRTHNGNVFKKGFFENPEYEKGESPHQWIKLDMLR